MKGSNVLIVDRGDSGYIRDLQREPYNIEIAESVPAVIEKVERGSFDAAVINIDLVGLNLLPTITKLCSGMVLIALSSDGSTRRVVEVIRMGFYDYIFYPFPSEYLVASINSGIRALFGHREKTKDIAAIASEKGIVGAVIQSMSDGLIVTDLSQRIAFCNSKAAELLKGVARDELRVTGGEPVTRHPSRVASLSELIGKSVDLSAESAKELELETSAGTVLMRTQPILDLGSRSQIGWVSVLTDITELRRSAQLMTEATLRCTHEMRAPLGAIRNYLTVLLDGNVGNLNDRQRFMLTRMVKRVDALLELERDLLDLSSIESGSSTLDMEPLSLADSVREVVDIMRPSAAEKGVRMRFLVEPDPLVTRADSGAIKRIFTNLVSNAIKYTSSGGIVQVRVGRDDGRAFVEIMDTGIGISADNIGRIFDKFFRVRDRQTAEIVGTGLGLPIVKALVDTHSGEIEVDSEVGRGSTFTVFLPIAEAAVVHERESKVIDSEKYILLSDLDTSFKDEISREPGGENIKHCFSCGTCVAACPVRWINEKYNPRKIIRMALLGMREQVLKSEFIWLCSTCYTCHERCPQEVRITEVMNVLRNMASREGYIHPAYIRQVNTIYTKGRLYEVDDFDNRKRERSGLPRISTDAREVKQIFEITGINNLTRVGKTLDSDQRSVISDQ